MGLSASQARLLSITARISDNELHSQQIANSKVRLADKTQEASREYVQALDSQKLVYTTYDAKGNATQVNLTPALLYDYSTIKNQYGISNNVGQLLVSSEMAKTYQTSKTLLDFLKANGCEVVDNPDYAYQLNTIRGDNSATLETVKAYYSEVSSYVDLTAIDAALVKDPSDVEQIGENASAVNRAINTWYNHINETDSQGKPTERNKKFHSLNGSFGEYINVLETFNLQFPNIDDAKYHVTGPGGKTYDKMFEEASSSCYNSATTYHSSGCYEHVLASLLLAPSEVDKSGSTPAADTSKFPKTYTTTTGKTQQIQANKINSSAIKGSGKVADMAEVGDYLIRNNVKVPNLTINYTTPITNTEAQKLLSYTKTDGSLKTYQEMIVDVFYAVENMSSLGLNYDDHLLPFLIKFQEGLVNALTLQQEYQQDVENWQTTLQTWKDEYTSVHNKFLQHIANIPDKQIPFTEDGKTQWFINLWHRLNGESNINVNYNVNGTDTSGQKWKVLENNLFKSQTWIQYALEQGLVTLEQVQFAKETDDATGIKSAKWQAKEYATCVDIKFVDDETAIAKAEAIYTRKLNEIEAQDKKFDNEIKKLDTEHNALQTEYESVKSVVDKNVERSFKAFS